MCRVPYFAAFQQIVDNPDAPSEVKEAAQQRLDRPTLQSLVSKAEHTVAAPPSDSTNFSCAIYSMDNKDFPEHAQEMSKGPITNWDAIMKLPGTLLKDTKKGFLAKNNDGSDIQDTCLDQTFNGFRTVWNFYNSCFGRNSVDDKGLQLRGTIHLSRGYDNAFWDSDRRSMFFGDGGRFDGRGWLMEDPNVRNVTHLTNWHATYALEILGHELTHGVVQSTAHLGDEQYDNDQRAEYSEASTLDEHIADCFGIMVSQFSRNEDAKSGNWDIAPGWYSEAAKQAMNWEKGYLRTFQIPQNPINQPDKGPKHMKDLVPFLKSNGRSQDPHANCGIPNHAFYVAAQSFGGFTWDNLGKIWYAALTDPTLKLATQQTFRGWRDLTTNHAERLFGADARDIMVKAWQEVGL